jgi:hypothetical protein
LLAEEAWLWIGGEVGLGRYQVMTGDFVREPMLHDQSVEALALDNLGRLWVGTLGNGIWLREAEGAWRHYTHDPAQPTSLPGDYIVGSGLAPDPTTPGGMWALVLHEGLVRWDGERWRQDHYAKQLPSTLLWTAYADPGDGSLWIGSEAGVTRYDGITWGALSAQDGLQSPAVYAIARGADGGYWLGGRSGLSYFLPDTTPPQVAIGKLSDAVRVSADGSHVVTLNQELFIDVQAGDLQTTAAKLSIWHRLKGPAGAGEWQPVERGFVPLRLSEPGDYLVEFLARDQSFNYSEVAALALTAVAPPVEVAVPVLGRVETGVFRALVALGSVALLGASYVTFEVLSTRRRGLAAVARSYNP